MGKRLLWLGLLAVLVGCGASDERSQSTSEPLRAPETSTSTTTATTTTTTTTTIPTTNFGGSISALLTTGFYGNVGSSSGEPDPDGTPCRSADGYSDLTPGAAVTIGDSTGATLAVVPLTEGFTVTQVRNSALEREQRSHRISGVFALRANRAEIAGEKLRALELRLAEAKQRIFDTDHPDDLSFEGHEFYATWCRMFFTAPELPVVPSYTVTVGNRGTQVYSREQLDEFQYKVDMFIE